MRRRLFTATIANGAAETESALAGLPVEFHAVPVSRIERVFHAEAVDGIFSRLHEFDWVFFASANAASIFLEHLTPSPGAFVPRIACVGPNTADFVERRGFAVSLVSEVHTGAALAEEFLARHGQERPSVLLPRPEKMGSDLLERLAAAGIAVTQLVLYRTEPLDASAAQKLTFCNSDLFVFMSPSGVKHFTRLYPIPEKAAAIAIGPTTAAALAAAGHANVVVAKRACREGLLDSVTFILNNSPQPEGC
jgi:uroporphyrinogen-III synthase